MATIAMHWFSQTLVFCNYNSIESVNLLQAIQDIEDGILNENTGTISDE